ncbi:Protein ltv1 [Dispira parvispora]|uniref:Protein ltv1 n=1 Tax=Dispira parvispora TaxID=1520584 RepID=A0A9W8AK93_9FUNG|nr:Protein ltv1 [Dispira parvispora]
MGKKAFIDRKNARHFQVVHRSQHDPLIADPESSNHVLVEVGAKKASSASKAPRSQTKPQNSENMEQLDSRVGQAALHGIYFDDREYDYMQHLKTIGDHPEGVFVEKRSQRSAQTTKPQGITFLDDKEPSEDADEPAASSSSVILPPEVLPSKDQMEVGLLNQEAYPRGLQLDMDPEVRATLEALEDDEAVEDGLDDDFFSMLNASEQVQYDKDEFSGERSEEQEFLWRVKQASLARQRRDSDSDYDSGSLDGMSDRQSIGTGFSMSSSAMFRNEKLTLLDDQFEKYEELYATSSESDYDSHDDEASDEDEGDGIREDFEEILDEFLDKYEIVGRRMATKSEGESGVEKLDIIRQTLARATVEDTHAESRGESNPRDEYDVIHCRDTDKRYDTWDCESVLSTYSNLENHPSLIPDEPHRRIKLNNRTGMPSLERVKTPKDTAVCDKKVNYGVARVKEETAEEKKMRKQAAKEIKKARRQERKVIKQTHKQAQLVAQATRNPCAYQIPLK